MIDFDFIGELEGKSLVGYVPKPDGGATEPGVTIANGFDIGQRTHMEIMRAFGTELGGKLAPYAGYTGYDAIDRLALIPLTIAESECAAINAYAHKEATDRLIAAWNKESFTPFSMIPDEAQTVVASVSFQYGSLAKATPNFWRQTTTGDWKGALANLRNFDDVFPTRRNKEADKLESRINEAQ